MQIHYSKIQVHDKELYVQHLEQYSGKNKPTIVFLHEGLGCIDLWKGFPQKVLEATGHNGIVFDRQGYGKSDPLSEPRPMDYLQQEALHWLPTTLDALGIKNPIIIGHSDGGTIGLVYASRYPTRLLITEAAHIYVEEVTLKGIEAVKGIFDARNMAKRLEKYHGDKTLTIFSAWADTWLHPDFKDWNVSQYMKDITCPALVIQGKQDEYATDAHAENIVELISSDTKEVLLVDNCKHSPHLEAKEVVLNAMVNFIKQNENH